MVSASVGKWRLKWVAGEREAGKSEGAGTNGHWPTAFKRDRQGCRSPWEREGPAELL
jgi:hypothetical protein